MTRYAVVRSGYTPIQQQWAAHRARHRMVYMRGGYGSGKTTWLVQEMINAARMNPGGRGMLVSPTYGSLTKAVLPKVVEQFPGAVRFPVGPGGNARRDLGPFARDWSAGERVLTMHTGFRVHFVSADYPPSYDGIEVCWEGIDEPRFVARSQWEVLKYRLRQPGYHHRISISGLPDMRWLYEEFGPGRDDRVAFEIQVSTLDNPHTDAAYKASFAALSPRRREVLERGGWQAQEGIVYGEEYDPRLGGSWIDVLPVAGRPTWITIDPGGAPYAAIIQRLEDGTDVVVSEVVLSTPRTDHHARAIVEECDRWAIKATAGLVIDVQARAKDRDMPGRTVQHTYLSTFSAGGILGPAVRGFQSCTTQLERDIPTGIARVRDLLLWGERRQLLIAARLGTQAHLQTMPEGRVGMDRSLRGYHYPDGRPTDRPEKDGVNDHACDAIRYWAVKIHGVLSAPDLTTHGLPTAPVRPLPRRGGVGALPPRTDRGTW